jgi:hypothetical protein
MQYLITKDQRDNFLQIMRNNLQDPDAYDAITEIESLPVLEGEPKKKVNLFLRERAQLEQEWYVLKQLKAAYTHLKLLTPITADMVTDEMVDAYLTAQRATMEEFDRILYRPNAGGLHTNTVRSACRAGLTSAVNAYLGAKK